MEPWIAVYTGVRILLKFGHAVAVHMNTSGEGTRQALDRAYLRAVKALEHEFGRTASEPTEYEQS